MIKTENRPLSDSGNDFNRDVELVARICNSDQKALELLYSSYYSRLSRFIARVITREDLIDEVINDVMYLVWEKAKSYNHQCKPSTWIFGIAYNRARQALRDTNRNNEESLENLIDNGISFEDDRSILQQLEMSDWLLPALGKLTPDQRAVIELTYFQGLAYSEIAEVMACPENTVKTRMHHARKKLATLLISND
jgi:RNA polymerase sigma factor (sigma-70 family)